MGAHTITIDERIPEDVMETTPTAPPHPGAAQFDDVLTTEEAARFLKISPQTLRAMVRDGRIQPRRFGANGRLWRFVRSELLAPAPTALPGRGAVAPTPPQAAPAAPTRTLQRINGVMRYR